MSYKKECTFIAVCDKYSELEWIAKVSEMRRAGILVATTFGGKMDRQIKRLLKDQPNAKVIKYMAPSSKVGRIDASQASDAGSKPAGATKE